MIEEIFLYIVLFLIGYSLIGKNLAVYKLPFICLGFSMFGHLIGTYLYSTTLSDSITQFFPDASPHFNGFGTNFVFNITWFIRHYFTANSVLETFYLYGAFAFLGSVLWYRLYLWYLDYFNIQGHSLMLPGLILMCWPSFLFFTAGMGKDSLCFFFIPLSFLSYLKVKKGRHVVFNGITLFFSVMMLVMIRPYLLMIGLLSFSAYLYPGWKNMNFGQLVLGLAALVSTIVACIWVLESMGGLHSIDLISIAQKIVYQQDYQSQGTYFPMPNVDPIFRLFFLPYGFVMNLVFPLFFFARNMQGYLASFENALLLCMIFFFCKNRKIMIFIVKENPTLKLLFYFFFFGMLFISAVNTNLGLAMRQKSMYLPCFFVIVALVYAYRRNAILNRIKIKV